MSKGGLNSSGPLTEQSRVAAAITSGVLAELDTRGWAVVDSIFDLEMCRTLRQELDALQTQSLMWRNVSHSLVDGVVAGVQTHNIYEAEPHLVEVGRIAPTFASMYKDCALLHALRPFLPTLSKQDIRLQCNAGHGGCFGLHVDAMYGLIKHDRREVTALFYVNDEDWDADRDGGCLRLFPFPNAPVEIAPKAGRLVLFSTTMMVHGTSPAWRRRYCFTIWLHTAESHEYGGCKDAPATAARVPELPEDIDSILSLQSQNGVMPSDIDAGENLRAKGHSSVDDQPWPRGVVEAVLAPQSRPHLVRLVYADDWEASILRSHIEGPGLNEMLEHHRRQVAEVKQRLPLELRKILASLPEAASNVMAFELGISPYGDSVKVAHALRQRFQEESTWWPSRGMRCKSRVGSLQGSFMVRRVLHLRQELESARQRMQDESGQTQMREKRPRTNAVEIARAALLELERLDMTVELLHKTSIGVEVNHAFWRRQAAEDIARRCAVIAKHWKVVYRHWRCDREIRSGMNCEVSAVEGGEQFCEQEHKSSVTAKHLQSYWC